MLVCNAISKWHYAAASIFFVMFFALICVRLLVYLRKAFSLVVKSCSLLKLCALGTPTRKRMQCKAATILQNCGKQCCRTLLIHSSVNHKKNHDLRHVVTDNASIGLVDITGRYTCTISFSFSPVFMIEISSRPPFCFLKRLHIVEE